MEYLKTLQDDVCKLTLKGKFTFADHASFRKLFDIFSNDNVQDVEIDLSGVEFVDSAALGMLLLARDEAKKGQKRLFLLKPEGQVKKMFEISKFYDLFSVK